MGKTLFDKVWDAHVVRELDGGRSVLYIDRHYIHEVTSPVAFLGLKNRGLKVARPAQTTGTPDHNVPTVDQHLLFCSFFFWLTSTEDYSLTF